MENYKFKIIIDWFFDDEYWELSTPNISLFSDHTDYAIIINLVLINIEFWILKKYING